MIAILSPAKNLDMEKINTDLYTKPIFMKEADILMKELRQYTPPELESLMKINSGLAEQNFMRHITWKKENNLSAGKQALLAYDGAVYRGINAKVITPIFKDYKKGTQKVITIYTKRARGLMS